MNKAIVNVLRRSAKLRGATSDDVQDALIHAEAILMRSPHISTNCGGKGPSTSTFVALEKVRKAIEKGN